MRARRSITVLAASAVVAVAALGGGTRAGRAEVPSVPEADLAAAVLGSLEDRPLRLPDGGGATVLSDGGDDAPLDPSRLITCLETVSEAGAWPDVWVVVQDAARSWDLLMHVALSADGRSVAIDTAVAAARRDWDHASIRDTVRDVTGRKPKVRNVVVQAFHERSATTFVYRTGIRERRGLMALLPEDAMLREARSVALAGGGRHTLAVVLVAPTFEPADCSTATGRAIGHVDRGTVRVVLAGERAIEATADVAEGLDLPPGTAVAVPRFACGADDPPGVPDETVVAGWLRSRTPLPVLEPAGEALAFRLPVVVDGGRALRDVRVVVDPSGPSIRIER